MSNKRSRAAQRLKLKTNNAKFMPESPADYGLTNYTFLSTLKNLPGNISSSVTNLYQIVFDKHQEGLDFVVDGLKGNPNLNLTKENNGSCPNPQLQAQVSCPYTVYTIKGKPFLAYDNLQLYSCDNYSVNANNTIQIKDAISNTCNIDESMPTVELAILIAISSAVGLTLVGASAICLYRRYSIYANAQQSAEENVDHRSIGTRISNCLSSLFYHRNNSLAQANAPLLQNTELSSANERGVSAGLNL